MSQITISKAQAVAIGRIGDEMYSLPADATLSLTAWHKQDEGYEASKDAIVDAVIATGSEVVEELRIFPGGRVDERQPDGTYR